MESNHGELDHTDGATSVDLDAWIHLPLDICRLILDRLGAFDILSFPLVCRPWADVYAEKRRLQPGAPTLLTSPSDCGYEIPDDWLRGLFFIINFLSREVFPVEVDGLIRERWIGGRDEWLVTTGETHDTFKLLNPITGDFIQLPNNSQGYLYADRVQLCQAPTRAKPDDYYFAIAISATMLAYAMTGGNDWITLENPDERWLCYSDAIVHRGSIIAICRSGNLWSWDLDQEGENPTLLWSSCVNTEEWTNFYFILAPSVNHNILIVSPYGDSAQSKSTQASCHSSSHINFFVDGAVLHEIDIDAQRITEVRDIGDQALFLGPNYPFYVPVPVPSGDLKRNSIYIADVSDNEVVAIDLSLEDLPGNASSIYFNGPYNSYQVPMWFRPAFPTSCVHNVMKTMSCR